MRKKRILDQRIKILEKTTVQTWNEFFPIFNIIAILSISGMQFGYGLCEITTIYNQRHLMLAYDINLPKGLGLGLLVGLMPIGGFIGNILGKCIISRVSIKYFFLNSGCVIISSTFYV